MKKIIGLVLLVTVIAAGFVGCKKIIKALFPGFDVDVPEMVFTIPYVPVPAGTPVIAGEQSLVSFTQHFNLDSIVKANTNGKFTGNDVTSVKLKQMTFTLDNPDTANNFANFKSARFTFSSNTQADAAQIASFTFPDVYTPTVSYTAPDNTPELRGYLTGNQLTYHAYGELRRYTTKAITIRIDVTIRVS